MPAYAIREWRQEEKPKALPEQIIETIDSCEDVAKTAKSRLKKFLAEMGIQDILEMDYPLRKAYQNYLFSACQIQSADRYLLAYDRTKQADSVSIQGVRDYLGHDYLEMTEQYIDYMPKKIAKENMGFFQKPEHNLAAGLRKKGGRDGK